MTDIMGGLTVANKEFILLTQNQQKIYDKCRKHVTPEKYIKACFKANRCPHCGSLLRFMGGVLDKDEACFCDSIYICSECNFACMPQDMEDMESDGDYSDFVKAKTWLTKTEKSRIRRAKFVVDAYWNYEGV